MGLSYIINLPAGLIIDGVPSGPANSYNGALTANPGDATIELSGGYLEAATPHLPAVR